MRKRDELSDGTSCLSKARDEELLFILLERDEATPETIRFWLRERVRLGLNVAGDAKLLEAASMAREIEVNREAARGMAAFESGPEAWAAWNAAMLDFGDDDGGTDS